MAGHGGLYSDYIERAKVPLFEADESHDSDKALVNFLLTPFARDMLKLLSARVRKAQRAVGGELLERAMCEVLQGAGLVESYWENAITGHPWQYEGAPGDSGPPQNEEGWERHWCLTEAAKKDLAKLSESEGKKP